MDETNKEKTLAEAISQIETLTADKTKLDSDLATASSRIAELETELNETREKLTALEQKQKLPRLRLKAEFLPLRQMQTAARRKALKNSQNALTRRKV